MTKAAVAKAILKVRALLERELGTPEVQIDPSAIPEEFRTLSGLAAQFGVGDDGTRADAMELMPEAFAFASDEAVSAMEPQLSNWINDGAWTDEKNAIVCLKQALSLRLSGLRDSAGASADARPIADLFAILEGLSKKS